MTQWTVRLSVTVVILEVGECQLAMAAFSKSRDKQQVVLLPSRAITGVGALPPPHGECTQNAAQDRDLQILLWKVNKENTPRLIAGQWTQLLDLHLAVLVSVLKTQFFGIPVEKKVLETRFFDGPVAIIPEVVDELWQRVDSVQPPSIEHQFNSIQAFRIGFTPAGAWT